MKLKDIMSRDLEFVDPKTSLQEAAKKMKDINAGPMPVVENQKPLGILTDRDITIRAVADGKDPRKTKVGEIMTQEVIACFEDQDVAEGAKIMGEKQVRRLMIVNRNQKLVGIVSLGNIATFTKDKELAGGALEEVSQH
jgi:CBS domain-containing protein